jgi:RimJ/RimL family protein N-acetyltransferase
VHGARTRDEIFYGYHMDDVVFESERCLIRNWRADDAQRAFDIYRHWEVARWLGRDPRAMESLDEAKSLVRHWAARNDESPIGGCWAVERKSDAVVAGTVILVPLPDGDGEFEVGWHFHPDSWGQGLATESARSALRWGFTHGLTEVYAVVRPDNDKSLAVCRRLGMQALGKTSKYYGAELELFVAGP